jgi:hypothetical protein
MEQAAIQLCSETCPAPDSCSLAVEKAYLAKPAAIEEKTVLAGLPSESRLPSAL